MKLLALILLCLSINSYGQFSLHIVPGIGSNSGVVSFPYEEAKSGFFIPWSIELETEMQISEKGAFGLFVRRKLNWKTGELFSGYHAESTCNYYGLNYKLFLSKIDGKKAFFGLGFSLAYGTEVADWEDSGGLSINWLKKYPDNDQLNNNSETTTNIRTSTNSTNSNIASGTDHFDLIQLGVTPFVRWHAGRFVWMVGLQLNGDLPINGKRTFIKEPIWWNTDYDEFEYRGTFSWTLTMSGGFRLF